MDAKTVRNTFLEFFKTKGHEIVPSAPIINKDDPTLMFTNSGMNQFKDFFLGNKKPSFPRAADTQKCLRVSGKHNDLEEVGLDTYHHTMFEMLGNWSFGDYFKREAISWAWELLTDKFNLPKDRLYVTIFEGDKSDNLSKDDDAYSIWKEVIDENRILLGNKKDNFWEMGDTGPCGPCSEIHIDLRNDEERKKISGAELVNKDHPLVVEIWNLVFMEFNRLASGELKNLPQKHVDTGMGFERLCMALQKKTSNYDTDIFQPIISKIAGLAGTEYGKDNKTDIALRVIADHIRAIVFAIVDGQLPSNTGAGYVIRRILRRAVRYGFNFLDLKQPFMYQLVELMVDQFKDVFPGLLEQRDFVQKVIKEEEAAFFRTLENGLNRLGQVIEELKKKDQKVISGKVAFELYDTYGFPLDLTSLIARENDLSVDVTGFQDEMSQQKARSKADAAKETGDWEIVNNVAFDSRFIGYEELEADVKIVKYRKIKQKQKELYQIVLDKTPFYAESGGQVGDTGTLEASGKKINIIDTKKENELIVHLATQLPADLNVTYHATVDKNKRRLIMNNHSATHLLHAALRKVLGTHVEQKGSLVTDGYLRFDFSHFAKMTMEEIREVERLVNERVRQNISLEERREIPISEAKEMGAMALFGEKYGEKVRVIVFDQDYSVELCGGTHVAATGQIGLFKITSESSVAAGVRRIEAITAIAAEKHVEEQEVLIEEAKDILKQPKDLLKSIQNLISEKNKLEKQLESMQQEQAGQLRGQLKDKALSKGDAQVIIEQVTVPSADVLKKLSFELKNQLPNLFMILAAQIDDKPMIAVTIDEQLAKSKNLNAGNIVRELAKEINGGGGGQPFFATAGGKNLEGLPKVIEKGRSYIEHF
ncbi:MAG: alanine--tRNA ligase [Candidatus Cyclobacteriaceae bacterium M2_1C_046]